MALEEPSTTLLYIHDLILEKMLLNNDLMFNTIPDKTRTHNNHQILIWTGLDPIKKFFCVYAGFERSDWLKFL